MDYNHISKLLERYFEGETSLDEEKLLRRYFSEGPVAEEHRPYEDLFRFFIAGRREGLTGEIVPLPTDRNAGSRSLHILRILWRAAAVAAIAAGAWLLYPESQTGATAIDWSKYEPASAEEAFQVTSKALKTASVKMNYGARQAAGKLSEVQRMF